MAIPAFELPAALEAHEPPEARGLGRDQVRLMVARRATGEIEHALFADLPSSLAPGDLVVVNTSATLPAAVSARRADGSRLELRFSTPAPGEDPESWWVVEPRTATGERAAGDPRAGGPLELPGGRSLSIIAPYGGARLWLARLGAGEPVLEYLWRYGRPIRYGYVGSEWPIDAYQTSFATEPGSAEMPSAGRPLTPQLVTRLIASGIAIAPLCLHTGVSSPERGESPAPERFSVPAATARLVEATRAWGGRVIAIGTTVVRALETAAGEDGRIEPASGWTRLVITPERGLRAVDGLLTGWHEPAASHLQMLEAVAGPELLARSYEAALEHGYLWHEFGDAHLILP